MLESIFFIALIYIIIGVVIILSKDGYAEGIKFNIETAKRIFTWPKLLFKK